MEMGSSTDIHIDLDSYVKANRAESSRSLGDKLKEGINWLKPKRSQDTLEDFDQSAESDPWFPALVLPNYSFFLIIYAPQSSCSVQLDETTTAHRISRLLRSWSLLHYCCEFVSA
jgi:hypothetical protein